MTNRPHGAAGVRIDVSIVLATIRVGFASKGESVDDHPPIHTETRVMNRKKLLPLAITVLIGAFFAFDLGRFASLEFLKSQQTALETLHAARPALVLGGFFVTYIAVAALSLPGAAVLTLAAGALFGLGTGLLVASFASSIGATLAFLAARHVLRDAVQARFGERLQSFDENVERDGAFYLFTLRLVPAFPFFLVNLVMGLTSIRTGTFYLVSQIGMLAGTAVFVNAGTQLARIDSLSGILSPALIASFALLGVFPLAARKALGLVRVATDRGPTAATGR